MGKENPKNLTKDLTFKNFRLFDTVYKNIWDQDGPGEMVILISHHGYHY